MAESLENVVFTEEYVMNCKEHAIRCSISISNGAAYSLETVNRRMAKCVSELGLSSLSAGAQELATKEMSGELRQIMKHCTGATENVYAAKDLLARIFDSSTITNAMPVRNNGGTPYKEHCDENVGYWSRKGGCFIVHGPAFTGTFLLALLATASVNPKIVTQKDIAKIDNRMDTMVSVMTHVLQEKNALKDRITELEEQSQLHSNVTEAIGLRIDHLWDSLGPPTEDGMYRFTSVSDQLHAESQREMVELKTGLHRYVKALKDVRTHCQLMDIRLTKRMELLENRDKKWPWSRSTQDIDNEGAEDADTLADNGKATHD
ncbi:hypothetical protein BCR34DRAFT_632473 [Clohesyomyces aquaticus]|uniref:Uncharacterized protein n=1 Tax=Clohesyomyces aquaticus TaxID=1231657 RepID=A0A1Y2A4H8_9PLEO|nr:hypothetical protein BCR34DRAFT_632473 [Clohesyomyces aquaticus]